MAPSATKASTAAWRATAPRPSPPQAFRKNEVEKSVECFDRVLELSPASYPYLWQRGLSLYYVGEFERGAKQFRDDVAVNPNDTEEAIWAWLCEAQVAGPEAATAAMLRVGRDPRPVMRAAYEVFSGRGGPEDILAAGGTDPQGKDRFYALLYHALWMEGHGDAAAARESMVAAVATRYARGSGDYMADLARVHVTRRGWDA